MKFIKALVVLTVTGVSNLGLATVATARPYNVQCTSTGQFCDRTVQVNFTSDGPGTEYGVVVKAPATHCSDVSYLVFDSQGRLIGSTDFLAPSRVYNYLSLGRNVPRGSQSIFIGAIGRNGGCNQGQLTSWGVEVTVSPVPQ